MIALKSWGVPFAAPTGRAWPVLGGVKHVSYTLANDSIVGNSATRFHAAREGRFHAGVDLQAAPGMQILAMESGTILGMIPGFVRLGTVVVAHPGVVAVYAEIAPDSLNRFGLKAGSRVAAGQSIGVGALNDSGNSMLHLELWRLDAAPKGFVPWFTSQPPPRGLLDPSQYLINLSDGKFQVSTSGSEKGPSIVGAVVASGIAAYLGYRWLS